MELEELEGVELKGVELDRLELEGVELERVELEGVDEDDEYDVLEGKLELFEREDELELAEVL